jgi:hypothetical protein
MTIAAVAAALPFAVLAADGNNPMPATPAGQSALFESLDANKDGRISMPEASADASLVETFSTADKDGDGYLNTAEYQRAVGKQKRNDTDGGGEPQPQ